MCSSIQVRQLLCYRYCCVQSIIYCLINMLTYHDEHNNVFMFYKTIINLSKSLNSLDLIYLA